MSGVNNNLENHRGAYTSWAQMRSRCSNPNVPEYVRYGGRGIKVCERWNSFANFLADMGERPDGCSIDRIDVNGDYSPENCRWASRAQQMRNTTRTRMVMIGGVTQTVQDWIIQRGLNRNTVRVRIHRGWTPYEAITR